MDNSKILSRNKGVFEKIYLVGNGRIADDCLRILVKREIPVSYIEVYSETFSFTKKLCERLGIEFLHYDRQDMKAFLMSIEEDSLIFSVHNSYIFPGAAIEKPNLTILNMHIAPLPKYRGMNAPTWEIYDQQEYAGVTWHEVAEDVDAGRIIDQKTFPIGPDDTAMKVLQSSFYAGVELFEKNLDMFLNKSYPTRPLEKTMTKLYLNKDLPNGGYMDDSWNFEKSYAFLRSLDYSGTSLMKLPKIKYEKKVYEIIKYRKIIEGEYNDFRTAEKTDSILRISWGGYCLSCTLREVAEQI